MSLPGHRRTSSDKRRRAAHFALVKPPLVKDKSGATHFSHVAAPGATEYNGHQIHVKGQKRKLEKLVKKAGASAKEQAHDHAHAHGPKQGHDHS